MVIGGFIGIRKGCSILMLGKIVVFVRENRSFFSFRKRGGKVYSGSVRFRNWLVKWGVRGLLEVGLGILGIKEIFLKGYVGYFVDFDDFFV